MLPSRSWTRITQEANDDREQMLTCVRSSLIFLSSFSFWSPKTVSGMIGRKGWPRSSSHCCRHSLSIHWVQWRWWYLLWWPDRTSAHHDSMRRRMRSAREGTSSTWSAFQRRLMRQERRSSRSLRRQARRQHRRRRRFLAGKSRHVSRVKWPHDSMRRWWRRWRWRVQSFREGSRSRQRRTWRPWLTLVHGLRRRQQRWPSNGWRLRWKARSCSWRCTWR